tara:strand:+ start:18571 stop:19149 length:579 start_codon:yes stop_codon:yes gene_type:complete
MLLPPRCRAIFGVAVTSLTRLRASKLRAWARERHFGEGMFCRVPKALAASHDLQQGADRQAPANQIAPAKASLSEAPKVASPPSSPIQVPKAPTRYMLAERTMFSTIRTLPVARAVAGRRLFHASAPAFVKVGDKLPDVELVENSPGNKVSLAKELTGKGLIIGEPPLMVLEAALFDSENVRRSRRILALVL